MKRDVFVRADETQTADGGRIGQYPAFQLAVLPDREENPTEYTVYPAGKPLTTTEWLTAAARVTVPVEECL